MSIVCGNIIIINRQPQYPPPVIMLILLQLSPLFELLFIFLFFLLFIIDSCFSNLELVAITTLKPKPPSPKP